jgi:hypothetical protein
MDIQDSELKAAVYGEVYASAQTRMQMIAAEIAQHKGKGFGSDEECALWAKEHLLDMVVISRSQKQFFNLTHLGEMVTLNAWKRAYCSDVLYVWEPPDEHGVSKQHPWSPDGYDYYDKAKIVGERSDGIRKPIHHRDYFTPTGYYDSLTETFNVAQPFPVFAKNTGRDTSHLYTYIKNIAGECSDHLLAWLRYKCMYPKQKTEIVPVIVSRTQGNGKTTFANVICRGLFGRSNVLVTDQYDANARFNADYANALIVCAEEKDEDDKRATAAALKSRSTGTEIRVEHKGVDPVYQDNYTEFVVTTNKDVPIKFEGNNDQRRFMVMGSNPEFTRETSELANEVFKKLYGYDADGNKVGTPFVDDQELIAQFKHELMSSERLEKVNLRAFPHTAEYERCKTLPRTSENTEIDGMLRTLAPFIKQSLIEKKVITEIKPAGSEEVLSLSQFITSVSALQYVPSLNGDPPYLALCRPLVFYDQQTARPFNHATVERGIIDCSAWLLSEFGLRVLPNQLPIPGGFMNIMSRYRNAPAARFTLAEDDDTSTRYDTVTKDAIAIQSTTVIVEPRIGERLRVNGQWKPDPAGEFETVNEMKPGTTTLQNKNANVQYMDTFLFEADDTTKQTYMIEQGRLKGPQPKNALTVYTERLRLQRAEADRLLDTGIAFRAVYSGGKSYHILVRIKDAPTTLEEYSWLHAHLCAHVISTKLNFDITTCDPARLTRAPITFERQSVYNGCTLVGTQMLYRERPGQVYEYNWRPIYEQWKNRPLEPWEHRKLRPVKQEYRDAMWALLSGTFWTDRRWHGRRQHCFFPAYRLCRLIGYSHEQLWDDGGILDGLNRYYRKNEIDYWRKRESSDIIKQIDADVTAQLEEEEGLD